MTVFALAITVALGFVAYRLSTGQQDIRPIADETVESANDQPVDGQSPTSEVVDRLTSERESLDKTVWSNEVLAQEYEEPFVRLWDELRNSTDKYAVLGSFPFKTIILGIPAGSQFHDSDVESISFEQGDAELTHAEWKDWLETMRSGGYELVQSEWHHSRFEPDPAGPRSIVSMTLHVHNKSQQKYYSIKGDLAVDWAADQIVPRNLEVTNLKVLLRRGEPMFSRAAVLDESSQPYHFLAMLMTCDLNDDGLSEIILPSFNTFYWNRGNWKFERDRLINLQRSNLTLSAILADFTGDGAVNLLGASNGELILFSRSEDGRFSEETSTTITLSEDLQDPMVITAGDIDADGDLDAWIGQYKTPYDKGQMPTPYYDANDGSPAYLLRNDGDGRFTDVTQESGLAAKRYRRTYSASFVDVDADNDLDLVVASDFSGLDIYTNDGSGSFVDVTESLVDNRHSFGMALTFGDYDLDSNLDLLMIGMSSTTARRLDHLGLGRDEFPEHQQFREEMGYGNRLYLGGESGFNQAPFNGQVARTGWSWGASSFDFDNDGDRDIYIGNGHISGSTAKDYCTRFWCHDIYTADSAEDPEIHDFLSSTLSMELKPISWNGFEHNVLFSNQQGGGFLDIGFQAGVATEFDSRNVISEDLNGDGRVDLLVVARENSKSPFAVHVFENKMESSSNWIGVRLNHAPCSGLGARVTALASGLLLTDVVTSGDSLKSQHAPVVHFGLGSIDTVDEITIQWPQSKPVRIERPMINQYHDVGRGQVPVAR